MSGRWKKKRIVLLLIAIATVLLILFVGIPTLGLVLNAVRCKNADKIIVSSWRGDILTFTNIEVICADGSGAVYQPIARELQSASRLAFSPDGRRVAFVSLQEDSQDHISVMNLDTSEIIRLSYTYGYESDPAWSTNGQQLAFHAYAIGAPDSGIYKINVACLNSGVDCASKATLLTYAGSSPAWSPDGERIVFEYSDGTTSAIYLMNEDGSNQINLTPNAPYNSNPAWSPDGQTISFYSSRNPPGIYLVKVDGSGLTYLTDGYQPTWSPNGRFVAFVSDRDGKGRRIGIADMQVRITALYLIARDGQETIKLTNNPVESINVYAWLPRAITPKD